MADATKPVESYVRAELAIRAIRDKSVDRKRALSEEVRTCKAFLHEQMLARGITCMEVCHERLTELCYVRLVNSTTEAAFTADEVVKLIFSLPYEEKRDMSPLQALEAKSAVSGHARSAVKLSSSKERGGVVVQPPPDLLCVAVGIASAREQLKQIAAADREASAAFASTKQELHDRVLSYVAAKEGRLQRITVPDGAGGTSRMYVLRVTERTAPTSARRRDVLDMARPLLDGVSAGELDDRDRVMALETQIRGSFSQRATEPRQSLLLQRGPLV